MTTSSPIFPDAQSFVFESREDWLAARRTCIGASDSPAIFQVGFANQSPVTVWDSKVRETPEDETDAELKKRWAIGKLIEPTLRAIFAYETGWPVEYPGEFTLFKSFSSPWIGASLDGVTYNEEFGWCPIELKNVSNFNKADWEDDAPLNYQVQCQQQMFVTGARRAFLLGLIGGSEPVIKTIDRNDKFIAAMLTKLADFWGYVERKEMPPLDASEATAQLLGKLWPVDSGATIALPDDATAWDRELLEAKDAIKAAEAKKVAAENKLKAAIGDATIGLLPHGGQYSWKLQKRAEYVCKATEFRVLRRKD